MSRHFVAFAVLALFGTALVLPEPSVAAPGGIRGFRPPFRAPVMIRPQARAGMLRGGPRAIRTHGAPQWRLPVAPRLSHGLARTTVRAPFVRLERRHHRGYISGYGYPITTDSDAAYIGTPYDPSQAIPVYAPPSVTDLADPAPPPMLAPRFSGTLSSARDENAEACRSERVTVPAAEGEREITVVRC